MLRKSRIRILFLDDEAERAQRFLRTHPNTMWVKTADECITQLNGKWDIISLDHDLGGERYVDSERMDCGMEVVRYLVEKKPEHLKKTLFFVHSLNADAALKMLENLQSAGYRCTYKPFLSFET